MSCEYGAWDPEKCEVEYLTRGEHKKLDPEKRTPTYKNAALNPKGAHYSTRKYERYVGWHAYVEAVARATATTNIMDNKPIHSWGEAEVDSRLAHPRAAQW